MILAEITSSEWLGIMAGIGAPLLTVVGGFGWAILHRMDANAREMRKEFAAYRESVDARIAPIEAVCRTMPHEYADREDMVREALNTRRQLESMRREFAELRGENSAAMQVVDKILSSIADRIADAVVSATKGASRDE